MDTENNKINNPSPEENAVEKETNEVRTEPVQNTPVSGNAYETDPIPQPQAPLNPINAPVFTGNPNFANNTDYSNNPIYTNNPAFVNNPDFTNAPAFANAPTPPKKKKKFLIPLIIILILVIAAGVFFALTATHVICINHEWTEATCKEPKACIYCDETEGKALGHDWSGATCTKDSRCKNCDKKGKKATGHTEGSWTVTKEATLIEFGTEELLCKNCSESLESRSTEKKDAAVIGESFNFTDIEFITWVMDNTTIEIGYDEAELFKEDSDITSYDLTLTDGTKGYLALDHDENGYVRVIMFYFAELSDAAAIVSVVAEDIDSSFSADYAIEGLIYYDFYYDADMSVYVSETEGIYRSMLAPVEYIENYGDSDSDYET